MASQGRAQIAQKGRIVLQGTEFGHHQRRAVPETVRQRLAQIRPGHIGTDNLGDEASSPADMPGDRVAPGCQGGIRRTLSAGIREEIGDEEV